jgi:hypothetical protein
MNMLYRQLRKQHRDQGITPALLAAYRSYIEIMQEAEQWHETFDGEWYLNGLRHPPGEYVITRVGPAVEKSDPQF